MSMPLLNAAGRRRAPVTLRGYLAGRPPRNKGLRYPPDPPTVEEIVAVMRQAGDGFHGARMRTFIVLLWRTGLRINEALTVTEHDLDPRLEAILASGAVALRVLLKISVTRALLPARTRISRRADPNRDRTARSRCLSWGRPLAGVGEAAFRADRAELEHPLRRVARRDTRDDPYRDRPSVARRCLHGSGVHCAWGLSDRRTQARA
jgi:integrase